MIKSGGSLPRPNLPHNLIDLIAHIHLAALKRIYDELGLSSWPVAQAPLQAPIAQARSYTADPVTLLLAAEQRLNDLMEEA